MHQEFSEAQLEKKLVQFNKLTSLSQRLNFWGNELKISYADFLGNFNENRIYHPFEICNPLSGKLNKEDWEELNEWLIENWRTEKTSDWKLLIRLNLDQLIDNFESKLESENTVDVVRLELKKVDESFVKQKPFGVNSEEHYENLIYSADHKTFWDYILYGIKPRYSNVRPGSHTIHIANGVTLAQYHLYLSDKISSQTKQSKPKKLSEISIRTQLQILSYLGVIDKIREQSNVKNATFLSLLLNKNEQNIRKELTHINQLTTANLSPEKKELKRELQQVLEVFEQLGLKTAIKKVKADIESLS